MYCSIWNAEIYGHLRARDVITFRILVNFYDDFMPSTECNLFDGLSHLSVS